MLSVTLLAEVEAEIKINVDSVGEEEGVGG